MAKKTNKWHSHGELDPGPKPVTKHEEAPEHERKRKIYSYLRLVELDAAPAYDFDPPLADDEAHEVQQQIRQEHYDQVKKHRKVLGLGTGEDQMEPSPAAEEADRDRAEKEAYNRAYPLTDAQKRDLDRKDGVQTSDKL